MKLAPNVIIFDNDECIGQFGIFSLLYVYSRYKEDTYPIDLNILKKSCIKYLLEDLLRPYIKPLFQYINKLKKLKKIDYIVMYTSAQNNISKKQSGYVFFLKKCIEEYCNVKSFYKKVLHRDNVIALKSKDGATIKDIGNALLTTKQRKLLYNNNRNVEKYVNKASKNTIMIDDRPHNIIGRNGIKIKVPVYRKSCNPDNLLNCINNVPNLRKKLKILGVYRKILNETKINYERTKNIKDKYILRIMKFIKKKYDR